MSGKPMPMLPSLQHFEIPLTSIMGLDMGRGGEVAGNWWRVIFSELSAQFRPRLARGISAGFR